MTPKEKAADIVSAAAIHALNAPGPAVGKVDTDVLREEIERALEEAYEQGYECRANLETQTPAG
jgi:hypothetical protein